MTMDIFMAGIGYIVWTLQRWLDTPWVCAVVIVSVALLLVAIGTVFASVNIRTWLVWREAKAFYAKPSEPFPKLWPEQRVIGSEEL